MTEEQIRYSRWTKLVDETVSSIRQLALELEHADVVGPATQAGSAVAALQRLSWSLQDSLNGGDREIRREAILKMWH